MMKKIGTDPPRGEREGGGGESTGSKKGDSSLFWAPKLREGRGGRRGRKKRERRERKERKGPWTLTQAEKEREREKREESQ